MSKPTDYKKLWRKEQQKVIMLNNKIDKLLYALDPAFEYLRTIITREQYVELMAKLDINVAFTEGKKDDEQK